MFYFSKSEVHGHSRTVPRQSELLCIGGELTNPPVVLSTNRSELSLLSWQWFTMNRRSVPCFQTTRDTVWVRFKFSFLNNKNKIWNVSWLYLSQLPTFIFCQVRFHFSCFVMFEYRINILHRAELIICWLNNTIKLRIIVLNKHFKCSNGMGLTS